MIKKRQISNYLEEELVVELRCCSGCFVDGLRETMKGHNLYVDQKKSWSYTNPYGLLFQKAWIEIKISTFGHGRIF
jgi:hypothetical protein